MPTDFSRPAIRNFEGDNFSFKAEKIIVAGLDKIAQETGTTLYMILLAAYYILLFRYTRQEDIIIGIPIAGRHHADLSGVIGMFVNTLPF